MPEVEDLEPYQFFLNSKTKEYDVIGPGLLDVKNGDTIQVKRKDGSLTGVVIKGITKPFVPKFGYYGGVTVAIGRVRGATAPKKKFGAT